MGLLNLVLKCTCGNRKFAHHILEKKEARKNESVTFVYRSGGGGSGIGFMFLLAPQGKEDSFFEIERTTEKMRCFVRGAEAGMRRSDCSLPPSLIRILYLSTTELALSLYRSIAPCSLVFSCSESSDSIAERTYRNSTSL